MLEKIKKLNKDEFFIIELKGKNIKKTNELELLNYQLTSLNSLFRSFVTTTLEEANKFNLERFFKEYYDKGIKLELLKKSILMESMPKEVYDYMLNIKNRIVYFIDFENKMIVLYKNNFKNR